MNPTFDLATVEAPFFDPLTGHMFLAHPLDAPGEPPLELELVHVQPLHTRPGTGVRAPFSLLFKPAGAGAARMRQGTYACDGGGLAREPIFLVPIRDPLRGLCLEAVFN